MESLINCPSVAIDSACGIFSVDWDFRCKPTGWKYSYILLFSQNHRMVGVGRDLCGSSSPTLLPKQGHHLFNACYIRR